MIHIESALLLAIPQAGDTDLVDSAVDFNDLDPTMFDRSGLVQWSCSAAGIAPTPPRAPPSKGVNEFDSAERRHCTHAARIPCVANGPKPTTEDEDMIKVRYFAERVFTPENPAPASWAGGMALLDGLTPEHQSSPEYPVIRRPVASGSHT